MLYFAGLVAGLLTVGIIEEFRISKQRKEEQNAHDLKWHGRTF